MSDSFIKCGLELVLSVGPIAGLGISSAKVLSVSEDGITVQTDGRLFFVRPGVLLDVKVPDRKQEGWATLVALDDTDERNLMVLSSPRWADSSRSPRCPADYRVKVSNVEATSEGPKLRQVAGHASNISMTGAKFVVGKELDTGSIYQVELFIGSAELPCTAVARVVRVTQGSGDHKDSWEVGCHYLRFISGLAEYAKAVGESAFSARPNEVRDFEDEELAA